MALASDPERRVIVPGEAPFGPITILVATLLVSFVAGGYLVALNWERLYQPDRGRRTLIWGGAGFLAGLLLAVLAYAAAPGPLVIGLILATNAVAGLGLVRWQAPAYADWVSRYGRPTWEQVNLRGALVALGGIAFVLGCIGLPLISLAILPAVNALLPDEVFQGDGLSLTYARAWAALDVSDDPACQLPETTCLIALRYESGLTFFDAVAVSDASATDAGNVTAGLWTLAADQPGAEWVAQDTFPVAGRTAARLIYRVPASATDVSAARTTLWRLVVLRPGGYLRLTITTAEPILLETVDVAAGEGPVGRLLAGLSFNP
jgi:hypothetical protein